MQMFLCNCFITPSHRLPHVIVAVLLVFLQICGVRWNAQIFILALHKLVPVDWKLCFVFAFKQTSMNNAIKNNLVSCINNMASKLQSRWRPVNLIDPKSLNEWSHQLNEDFIIIFFSFCNWVVIVFSSLWDNRVRATDMSTHSNNWLLS